MKFDPEKIKKDAKRSLQTYLNEGKDWSGTPTLNERYFRTTV